MPVLGLQLMMLKDQINEKGMYEVLRDVRELDIDAVEVSQVEMTDELIDDLVRGKADFGVETAAMSASIAPGGNGFALETEFERAVEACTKTGSRFLRIGMMPFEAMTSKQALRSGRHGVGRALRRPPRRAGRDAVLSQPPRGSHPVRG